MAALEELGFAHEADVPARADGQEEGVEEALVVGGDDECALARHAVDTGYMHVEVEAEQGPDEAAHDRIEQARLPSLPSQPVCLGDAHAAASGRGLVAVGGSSGGGIWDGVDMASLYATLPRPTNGQPTASPRLGRCAVNCAKAASAITLPPTPIM